MCDLCPATAVPESTLRVRLPNGCIKLVRLCAMCISIVRQ